MRRIGITLVSSFATLAATTVTSAQEPTDESDIDFAQASQLSTEIDFRFTAGIWLPRFRQTDVELGGGPVQSNIDLRTDLDLSDAGPGLKGEAEFSYDRWHVRLAVTEFSIDSSSTASRGFTFGDVGVAAGDSLRSTFDFSMLSAEIGYEFLPIDEDRLKVRVRPVAEVRYIDIDSSVEVVGPSGARDNGGVASLAALLGGRLEIELLDQIVVDGGVSAGVSFDGGLLTTVAAGLTWYPNRGPLGLSFGYRLVHMRGLEGDDGFEFDGRLAGIFLGGSIRF